jgi:exopolyphosphatase/guanosine-5'-triphosphate,3'-diphosphate pyrophosphatase
MKPTENIAVIDIGSNTIRLLIGKLKNEKIKRIYTDRAVTRLGKDLSKKKTLNSKSIEKSIKIISHFKALTEQYNTNPIIAIGTSALREAEDSAMFCEKIKELTGINIKVISGEEEALYTLEGIRLCLPYPSYVLFALDIGGGSTEWIFSNNTNTIKGSIDIGALKSYKEFFKSDPPLQSEIEKFRNYLKEKIIKSIPSIDIDKVIATGGTAVTLAMIELKLDKYIPDKIHMREISLSKLKLIIEEISKTSLNERKNIKGLMPERADIILPGLIILESIADYVNSYKITISDYGIMEGVMKNYKNFCYN